MITSVNNLYGPCRIALGLLTLVCTGCFHPPYNQFQPDPRPTQRVVQAAGVGASMGAVAGAVAGGNVVGGAAIGGLMGTVTGLYGDSKRALIDTLHHEEIELVQYGDTMSLRIPTDRYYQFNSARLNDRCYNGLLHTVRLLHYYPCTPIYVAAFTDNVGSRQHKRRLSQAQAETMLTFLWAHHISAQRLQADGYADNHSIGDNALIHGSAYNRRIEIQWSTATNACAPKAPMAAMK